MKELFIIVIVEESPSSMSWDPETCAQLTSVFNLIFLTYKMIPGLYIM